MQKSSGTAGKGSERVSRRTLLRRAGALTATVGLSRLAGPWGIGLPTRVKAAPAVRELTFLNVSRGMARPLGVLAARYEAQRGVKVTVDTPGPLEYPQKLLAGAQTNNMPDVFFLPPTAAYAPYIKAGWALPLKPELDRGWKDNFSTVALQLIEWKADNPFGVPPGIFQVPLEIATFQMLYNPALFARANVPPDRVPFTMPQLFDVLKALRAARSGPFTTSVEAIPILLQSFVSNWLTDGEIDDTHAGKLPWSSGAYKKALQIYVDMNEAGLIFNSPLNLRWAEMERSFYNVREVGVIYDGQWSIAVQRATAPDFTAYRSFRVPRAADAKHAQRSVGQADRNLAVNAKGRHVEESLAFLKWLTDREQAEYLMEAVPMLPTNPAALLDATKIPPQFSAFHIEGPRAMRISTPRKQQVDEALTKGIQALLLKQTDVDRVLADADRAQRS